MRHSSKRSGSAWPYLVVPLLVAFSSSAQAAGDPFTPYLESSAQVRQSIGQTSSGTGPTAIVTKRFTLSSKGGVNTVFAIQGSPQQAGVYPGLLLLHGGGSHAEDLAGMVEDYARRGYVTLAIDQPGICGLDNTPNSAGPWKSRPGGEEPRFDVAAGPENSILVDAEVADIEAFNWLRSQANVSASAMGITGFSWGGYSTTMLSGLLGTKVKASYAVFGCGFYEKGSFWKDRIAAMAPAARDVWLMYLDAGRRGAQVKASYFLEAETNDTFFWPEAVGATMEAIAGPKNHVWGPNLNHTQLPSGGAMQRLYFDYYLKGTGNGFANARVSIIENQPDGGKKVSIDVAAPAGVSISSVDLYYSERGPTWQNRKWVAISAPREASGAYAAIIPSNLAGKPIDFYALATDTRTFLVSTAMFDSSSVVPAAVADAGSVDGASGQETDSAGMAPTADAAITERGPDATVSPDPSGAGGAGAAPRATPPADAESGCACRTGYRSPSGGWAGILVGAAWLMRRRRC